MQSSKSTALTTVSAPRKRTEEISEYVSKLHGWPEFLVQSRWFTIRLDIISGWFRFRRHDRDAIATAFCRRASEIIYAKSQASAEIKLTRRLTIDWFGKTPGRRRNGYFYLRETASVKNTSHDKTGPIGFKLHLSKKYPITAPTKSFDEKQDIELLGDWNEINGWLALEGILTGQLASGGVPKDRWRKSFRFRSKVTSEQYWI